MLRRRDIKDIFNKHVFQGSIGELSDVTIQQINYLMFKAMGAPPIEFSDYKVSTITTKCNLNKNIDLTKFAAQLYDEIVAKNMLVVEFKYLNRIYNHELAMETDDNITRYLEEYNKVYKKTKNTKVKIPFILYVPTALQETDTSIVKSTIDIEKNHMGNSITLRLMSSGAAFGQRIINLKLFQNGKITITGCKEMGGDDGRRCVDMVVSIINKNADIYFNDDVDKLAFSDYITTMYNVCFSFNVRIDQYKIYNVLLRENIYVTMNPEISSPVHVIFMWNNNHLIKDGICKCEPSCIIENQKKKQLKKTQVASKTFKKGTSENNCKAVTLNIHSSNIIITGDDNIESIEYIKNFIIGIINANYQEIIQYSILNCSTDKFDMDVKDMSPPDQVALIKNIKSLL
jgi:hypothetical protein